MNALQQVRNQIKAAINSGCKVAQKMLVGVKLGGKGVNTATLTQIYSKYLYALKQAAKTVQRGLTSIQKKIVNNSGNFKDLVRLTHTSTVGYKRVKSAKRGFAA